MRILTFTHLFPNAAHPNWGIFVYQRVRHFASLPGNEAVVVAPVPYVPRWLRIKSLERYQRVPEEEVVGGLRVLHPRYPHIPKIAMPLHGLLLYLGCRRQVHRLFKEKCFDCIDSHWVYPDGFAAVLLGKRFQVPAFCSARGTDINVYPGFASVRPLIRGLLRRATGVIAVSEALKEAIVRLGISASKIRVIGNGIDEQRFYPLDRRAAREKLNLPIDSRIAISVGSLNEHKNHALLIAAVAKILASHPSLKLIIIGDGPLRESLSHLIQQFGLTEHVVLAGNQPNADLLWWYNAADVSCLPSLREGWPNVLMESIACGTPVVATRVGGIPEAMRSGEQGFIVEPTPGDFSAGLDSALAKSWNREAITQYALTRTWSHVALEMQSFFQQCISQPGS